MQPSTILPIYKKVLKGLRAVVCMFLFVCRDRLKNCQTSIIYLISYESIDFMMVR